MVSYYIPTTFFSSYTIDNISIRWHGKGGVVGIVPVYNNIDDLKRKHPNSEYIEIEEELGQA